jgi:hypothetical protein
MADENSNAPKKKRSYEENLARVKARSAKAQANSEKVVSEKPAQLFLPGFDIGAMPNHINRSSLFAPIARGKRKLHHETVMVTRADCVLEYSGQQLDEADATLIMTLIFLAQAYPLGIMVPLNRAEVLRKMLRSTGKHDYVWLHKRLKALRAGTMFIEARKQDGGTKYKLGGMESFNIIKELAGFDEDGAEYEYMIDPRWIKLFSGNEYSLIDFEKRLQIGRGQDMAKTLQRLVATSSDPIQRYSLDWLKAKMEYAGRIRDYKDALQAAVAELERLEIIAKGKIEVSTKGKEQLTLWIQKELDPMA